jgi:hypothetical protein
LAAGPLDVRGLAERVAAEPAKDTKGRPWESMPATLPTPGPGALEGAAGARSASSGDKSIMLSRPSTEGVAFSGEGEKGEDWEGARAGFFLAVIGVSFSRRQIPLRRFSRRL